MIVDERIVTFINSLDTKNSEILETIESEARASSVPIIRREMQSFLKTLLMIKKPMRILEVGTAVGFSALLMSEYAPAECRITTIENYEKRIPIARENFRRAGREQQITLIEGDAAEVPPAMLSKESRMQNILLTIFFINFISLQITHILCNTDLKKRFIKRQN